MSTEKFFEYAGRPVEMVDRAQFLKAKPEQVAESNIVGPLPCPASASPRNQNKALRNDDHTYLDRRMVRRHHLQQLSVQHAQLQVPVSLIAFHLGFAVRALQPTSMFLHAI
jgi:hypothetical protein